jgi:hypothetical protein
MLEKSDGSILDYFLDKCDPKHKIQKQIINVKSNVKDQFKKFVDDVILTGGGVKSRVLTKEYPNYFINKSDLIKELRDQSLTLTKPGGDDKFIKSKIGRVVAKYQSLVMDYYLIHRLFREFRIIEGKYSEKPKHIIIYAGDAHSTRYSEFLTYIGFQKIQEVVSENQYLDISKFKQPFFQ